MTPTLNGRWQSRLFLLGTIGLILSFGFAVMFQSAIPLILLIIVIILGLLWDVLYDVMQKRRWDRDWPPTYQLFAGIIEGLFIYAVIVFVGAMRPFPLPTAAQFWAHYTTVWVAVFIASQSIMRLIFPRWRYNGGEII